MKTHLLFGIMVLTVTGCISQNLVVNGGLEQTMAYGPSKGFNETHITGTQLAPGWFTPTPATADFYNSELSVTDKDAFVVPARSGEGRIGMICAGDEALPNGVDYKEYAMGRLVSPLEKDKLYAVKFYVRHDPRSLSAIGKIGMYISKDSIAYDVQLKLPYYPQIIQPANKIITAKDGWVEISGTYKATGGEKYICIGSFSFYPYITLHQMGLNRLNIDYVDNRVSGSGYYYIDDISVEKEDSTAMNKPTNTNRLLFLVDVSNSMARYGKIDSLKTGFKTLIKSLPPSTEIAIVTFNTTSHLALPFCSVKNENRIINAIDSLKAGGNTDFTHSIQFAYGYMKKNQFKEGTSKIVVLTDGVFPVVPVAQDLIQKTFTENNISFNALQFGPDINKDLKKLAHDADGKYIVETEKNVHESIKQITAVKEEEDLEKKYYDRPAPLEKGRSFVRKMAINNNGSTFFYYGSILVGLIYAAVHKN